MHWKHTYKVVAAEQGSGSATSNLTGQISYNVPMTTVLYRCECGVVKSKPIEGHWTLEQLTNQ